MDRSFPLGVLYANARSLKHKFYELGTLVDKLRPLIVAVTETWLVHDFDITPELSGYHCLRSDRHRCRKGGGVLLYIANSINIRSSVCESHDSGTSEAISCELTVGCCTFALGVIYRSPICLADDFILEHIRLWSANNRCLILGDFNAPDISWTEMTTKCSINSFDSRLLETVMEHALVQHVSKPTRFGVNQGSSLLDLVITHETEDIANLNILPPLVNSDHAVLSFTFRASDMIYDQIKPRPNIWRANIPEIQDCATKIDWSVDTSSSVDEAWSVFKGKFSAVTSPFIPYLVPRRPNNSPPWINKEVKKLLRCRKKHWNMFISTGLEQYRSSYRKIRNNCKALISRTRRSYEKQLVRDCKHSPKRLFSYIKRRTQRSDGIPSLLIQENPLSLARNDTEKAEAFSEYFSKVFSTYNEERSPIHCDCGDLLMDPVVIKKETVLSLLQHLKPDKSSGPDDIHPRIMKALSDVIAEPLAMLFDMSLRQSRLPRDWKDAIISPVYKTGGRDLVSNYRPVSLTSAVVKLMEKIIRMAVINYVERHDLLSKEQHGFRKGLSCLTNLLIAREDWAEAKDRNIPVDVIFIDLSKAFDKVSHSGLKLKLESFGIHYAVIDWISDFLHERRQRVRVNGALSSWEPVKSGVPQGTILGPLLFLLYINELPAIAKSSVLLFADDIKIWRPIYSMSDRIVLQEDLNSLVAWMNGWSLEVNPNKSVVMQLNNYDDSYHYTLCGLVLPKVRNYKDLGVILSNDLKTTSHCKAAAAKGYRALWSIRRSFRYLDGEMFRLLYPTFVRPHLEYGIQAASPCFKYEADMLERVQRRGTKMVKGLSSLSYEDRLRHLNLFPLSYRRIRGDLILAYRILNDDLGTNMSYLFLPSRAEHLRGHSKKVQKPRSNRLRLEFRFSHRVVNYWNSLPEHVISAPSVDIFKTRLDLHSVTNCKD